MSASTRTYLLAVVGLSTVLWDLGFNLGAFGTIFFDKLFFVWVACTTILIGSLFVPAKKRPFGPFGAVVMTLPTVWLILQVWDTLSINEAEIIDIDMVFRNSGDLPISGEAIIQVQTKAGVIVSEYQASINDLVAGASFPVAFAWDSTGVSENEYRVVGFVKYNSQTTPTSSAILTVSNDLQIDVFLPLILR